MYDLFASDEPDNPIFHRHLDQDTYRKALATKYTPLQFATFLKDIFGDELSSYVREIGEDPLLHLFITFPGKALATIFDYFCVSKEDFPEFDVNVLIWAFIDEQTDVSRIDDDSVLQKFRLLGRLGVFFDLRKKPQEYGYGKTSNLELLEYHMDLFPQTIVYLKEEGYIFIKPVCDHPHDTRCGLCLDECGGYCG